MSPLLKSNRALSQTKLCVKQACRKIQPHKLQLVHGLWLFLAFLTHTCMAKADVSDTFSGLVSRIDASFKWTDQDQKLDRPRMGTSKLSWLSDAVKSNAWHLSDLSS